MKLRDFPNENDTLAPVWKRQVGSMIYPFVSRIMGYTGLVKPSKTQPRRLTKAQKMYLRGLRRVLDFHGSTPPLRDIAEEIGRSHASVIEMLARLEQLGLMKRDEKGAITYLYKLPGMDRPVSVETDVAAGAPLSYVDEPAELVDLPRLDTEIPGHKYVRVRGTSMTKAGINSGDLILVREQSTVLPNEPAVVSIGDDGLTLKYVDILPRKRVRLRPASDEHEPWEEPAERVRIVGKLVALIRMYG